MKPVVDLVKAHPYWTGWIVVGILYAVGISLEVGTAYGCFILGGMILFGIIIEAGD